MDDVVRLQQQAAEERWLDHWLAGPTHTRHDSLPVQSGDPAPDVELTDLDGNRRHLSDFWRERPVHLFLMRHYGCSCMRDRWGQLREECGRIREAGAETVAIGCGEPERTHRFAEVRGIPCPVLCDPEMRAYDAYGIVEGAVSAILHDFEWRPGDEDTGGRLLESRRDTDLALVDNPWLLPAEFVIDPEGMIRHAHRYQYCEDFPPITVLLGAIAAAG